MEHWGYAPRLVVYTSNLGGLDGVDRAGLGVLGDQVSRDAEFCSDSLPINGGAIGLAERSLVGSALKHLLAGHGRLILEVSLDGIGLLGQLCDLGVESAEGVDGNTLLDISEELDLGGGERCIHDSLSLRPAHRSDASVSDY